MEFLCSFLRRHFAGKPVVGRCRLFCQGTIDQTAIFVSYFVLYNLKRNLKGSYVNIFCQKSLSYANHYQLPMASSGPEKLQFHIQLFREKLSVKVHATIPKGIMGGFEFTVLRRNLKEWHERPWTSVCEH